MNNIIVFEDDQEFFDFCVDKELKIEDGTNNSYITWNFTKSYNDAIKEGKTFMIKDPDSKIAKRKALSFHTITKYVENVVEYSEIFLKLD